MLTKARDLDVIVAEANSPALRIAALDHLARCFRGGHIDDIPDAMPLDEAVELYADRMSPVPLAAAKLLIWLDAVEQARLRYENNDPQREAWAWQVWEGDTELGFAEWCAARDDEAGL